MIQIRKPETINKGWGREILIDNNEEYCGKILEFNKGARFSNHFHLKKRETFYVLCGRLILWYYNLNNADRYQRELFPGDVIEIGRGEPHQIEALEDSKIIEVSTHHEDLDSYRINKGDSQNEK